MTSPFSCSAASSGLPILFHMSKASSKWGPSSPGQELLCVSRRKFANLDLLRIRHFEKFDFRSDTHGTGLIHGKYQTGNRAIWLVDFLYQPSQELSRVISLDIGVLWGLKAPHIGGPGNNHHTGSIIQVQTILAFYPCPPGAMKLKIQVGNNFFFSPSKMQHSPYKSWEQYGWSFVKSNFVLSLVGRAIVSHSTIFDNLPSASPTPPHTSI